MCLGHPPSFLWELGRACQDFWDLTDSAYAFLLCQSQDCMAAALACSKILKELAKEEEDTDTTDDMLALAEEYEHKAIGEQEGTRTPELCFHPRAAPTSQRCSRTPELLLYPRAAPIPCSTGELYPEDIWGVRNEGPILTVGDCAPKAVPAGWWEYRECHGVVQCPDPAQKADSVGAWPQSSPSSSWCWPFQVCSQTATARMNREPRSFSPVSLKPGGRQPACSWHWRPRT